MNKSKDQRTPRRRITLERIYEATLEEVWALWTTKDGIESWWGPDGFEVKVGKLDLRAGGEMSYAMTAVAPPQVEFMKQAGMPLTTECRITYLEVMPPKRLVYSHLVDFVPGVDKYDVDTMVELQAEGSRVRMRLTLDAMHDDEWTQRAVMGWESELGKLAKIIRCVEAR